MMVLCEPQCIGFEHAEVNAALIATAAFAFPGERIVFLAEEAHIAIVRKRLEIEAVGGVEFRTIAVPPRRMSESRRVLRDLALCKQVVRIARENQADKLLLTSTTSPGLFSMKRLVSRSEGARCAVVVHGILETIDVPPKLSFKLWRRLLWFRKALLYKEDAPVRYLVLGPLIEEELCSRLPQITDSVRSIHLPYFYDEPPAFTPFGDDTVQFGFFGTVGRGKGADVLYRLAQDLAAAPTKCRPRFTLIGPVLDKAVRELRADNVYAPSPDAPLSREEYDRHAWRMDYSVHFHTPGSYRLRASASLFDSFYYAKPIIAFRSHCLDHYFELMGDIGHICDSYEEMTEVILNLLDNPSVERYTQQRDNILRGRSAFAPCEQASKIVSLFE